MRLHNAVWYEDREGVKWELEFALFFRDGGISISGGGGLIFIYSYSQTLKTMDFKRN